MSQVEALRSPPRTLREMVAYLGPGLIISANIVGSGELIVTTQLGAKAGFALLWFIIFSCLIKVFVQIELGRYAVSEGVTTLVALDRLPGPRAVVSWILWLWVVMYVGTLFQMSGMVGGIASLFATRGEVWAHTVWTLIPAAACALILSRGRYGPVEKVSTLLVVTFTLVTMAAVVALYWTPYRIGVDEIRHGLSLHRPDSFTTAFAAFGVTGMGASELIFYPYWCLEKGYARFVGPRDASAEWLDRAQGWLRMMRVDAWLSMVIYTLGTICFYLLGAAVLHATGQEVSGDQMVPALSSMYVGAFGPAGGYIFLIGAFAVLFSTVFVSTASNARLFADGAVLLRPSRSSSPEQRARLVRAACVGIPVFLVIVYMVVGAPVYLVMVGALAQALMLPFLAFAALYMRYRLTTESLRPGRAWTLLLWVAFASMTAVGLYQFGRQLTLWG
ncbi:MAG: Nramp family divalent metal transporter [Acidobacteria bacterium]|nr:Nramp family divalent metal transporter [Acidobacteriota bacterium]